MGMKIGDWHEEKTNVGKKMKSGMITQPLFRPTSRKTGTTATPARRASGMPIAQHQNRDTLRKSFTHTLFSS